jgi:hypothetical protein
MSYRLIHTEVSTKPCQIHSKENILDLFNSGYWKLTPVAVDKLQFICDICKSKRIYKLLTEKTLLKNAN